MTKTVDFLFTNALVLTMDEELHQYEPGAVAVTGDSIVAIGPQAEMCSQYNPAQDNDSGGKVLMPGLVNAHTHLPMTMLR
ncbi:MAG: amidohydrolase, partial [Anaerolineales bacterium]|nr:amidohydrolase [Anaerolineales bacterium]